MKRFACQVTDKGFTLLEVLIAMGIFAIAGVALLGVADTNFKSLSQIEQRTVALWVASNQLVEANLSQTWPPKDNLNGKVEMAGTEWFWLQKVLKTNDEELRHITIEVRLEEKEEQAITQLSTYVSKVEK